MNVGNNHGRCSCYSRFGFYPVLASEGIRPVGRSVRERVRKPFANRSANPASYGRYSRLATLLRADLAVAGNRLYNKLSL